MDKNNENNGIQQATDAVNILKTAILQSQARAVKAVNQEQLALYYGIGRYISANTRNKHWGSGMIKSISQSLRSELPGLRGFGESQLKNMRLFYESWSMLESNSPITTGEIENNLQVDDNEYSTIRQLQLANLPDFPIIEFLSISFTHHIRIIENVKDINERLFYIRYCHNYKPTTETLPSIIKKQDLYHHQGAMPNNFLATIPDYKQAYRTIKMFKDEYLLDFVNVDLRRLVVFELKKGQFKTAYLAQLSSYLRILNDDDRREGEEPPIGIILCKSADKAYVEYIMQDFRQPMGVATYKTADEMDEELMKVLPSKEQLEKLLED